MVRPVDYRQIIMMLLSLVIQILLIFACVKARANYANATILIMYSGHGIYANLSDTLTLKNYWQKHLEAKFLSDPSWKVHAHIELFDTLSDAARSVTFILKRLVDKSLPNITAIVGPEAAYMAYPVAAVAASHGIPIIFCPYANGISPQAIRPPSFATSFFTYPAAVHEYSSLLDIYIKAGVKSMAFVYYYTPFSLGEANGCLGAAQVAASRGIKILAKIPYVIANTSDELYSIITAMRDYYRPDALLWCSASACVTPSHVYYHPLPLLKRANYLPKALGFRGECFDTPLMIPFYEQGLFQFVSGGQWFNAKVSGPDYTEEGYPYSSVFRPNTSAYFTVSSLSSSCIKF